jgi:AcrR family transcriptional regulator
VEVASVGNDVKEAESRRGGDSVIAERRARAKKNREYRERREALIRRAAELFHLRGLNDTSLADIAREAGLDRASVYYYFANKEEILVEVLHEALNQQASEEKVIDRAGLPPDEKLRRLIQLGMRQFDRHYPYLYVYVREDMDALPISPELKKWIVRKANRTFNIWRDTIAQGVHDGLFEIDLPIGIAAWTLLGALAWTHRWYQPDGSMGAEAIGHGLARLLVDGLRPLDRDGP